MNLRVIREPSVGEATLGVLFVDDVYLCFVLEDRIREISGQPVETWKIPGRTAIPSGRYPVRVSWSPRFKRNLPELLNVPGFTGIRIHSGNRPSDTEGCLLVGFQRANAVVLQSRPAMEEIDHRLMSAQRRGDPIWINIENPPSYGGNQGAK